MDILSELAQVFGPDQADSHNLRLWLIHDYKKGYVSYLDESKFNYTTKTLRVTISMYKQPNSKEPPEKQLRIANNRIRELEDTVADMLCQLEAARQAFNLSNGKFETEKPNAQQLNPNATNFIQINNSLINVNSSQDTLAQLSREISDLKNDIVVREMTNEALNAKLIETSESYQDELKLLTLQIDDLTSQIENLKQKNSILAKERDTTHMVGAECVENLKLFEYNLVLERQKNRQEIDLKGNQITRLYILFVAQRKHKH